MASMDKFNEVADELIRCEARLKEEDFSTYTLEALDFEKAELNKLWEKYKSVYEACVAEPIEKKKELMSVHTKHNQVHRTHVKCINVLARAKRRLPKEESSSSKTVVPKQSFSIPIQACDVDVFSGDYASWPTFRDLFTSIYINNDRLGPVEKLCFLFQKTSGDAREVNRNITVTAENFDIAWENLRSTYENKRVLFNNQMNLLYTLAPCQEESASEIKRLQREINNCISTLRLYKVDVEAWDPLFVFHSSIRLPKQTLNLWEQSVKNKTEIPKWKEINKFLTDRFRALESICNVRASNSQTSFPFNNQQHNKAKQFKTHHTKANVVQCKICKEAHEISSCQKFLNMDYKNRVSVLRKFKYCFNCLKTGHMFGECFRPNGCSKCKRKHHILLHKEFTQKVAQEIPCNGDVRVNEPQISFQSFQMPSTSNVVQNHHHSVSKKVLLATAWVNIEYYGTAYKVRALIDPCSDESFISEKICKLLKLSTVPVAAEVAGLGGEVISRSDKMATFSVASLTKPNLSLKITALVVPHVTGNIPTHSFAPDVNIRMPNLDLADPMFYKSGAVDMLLGGDVYPSILRGGVQHGIFESLVAQETIFGWIVTGPTTPCRSVRQSFLTKVSIDDQLSKFWDIEEVSHKPVISEEDKLCEEIFRSTTVRNAEGRYIVDLPFKAAISSLGPNRHIALKQFMRNENLLLRKPENKILYDEVVKEYVTLAHMEKIEDPVVGPSYYLPHHGVLKPESTTTKLRVVFNASSLTATGKSLNDILYTGPTLQKDLVGLMLKWRFYKFVFNADISKMYRQILVNPEHACFQQIVYRSSPDEEIQDYKLKTVTFGVNCAPYLALRTLLRLADDEERHYPLGARILRDSMYVDDALVGAHNLPDILEARNQLIAILESAGFSLRKWTSNMKEILTGLPTEHLLNENFLCLDDKSNAKTLGIRWNASADYFYFTTEKIPFKSSYTKREVLATIARLFDPAGWLAPVIITAKILMQQMWLDKIDWDEKIKPMVLRNWQGFVSRYNDIDKITVPRWIQYAPCSFIEFHGFCDASELAYAATLYARVQIGEKVITNLLVAKTKVAPIKKISIPRLELCGAVLLSKLIDSIMPQFSLKNYTLYLWSDSTIVLAWLKKPPCNWKTFVANRVSIILDKVGNRNWYHVLSQYNPADLATRGLIPSELKNCALWWNGPEWLKLQKKSWPSFSSEFDTIEESKIAQNYVARSTEKEDILDRFSSLPKAIHVIAYIFRFFNAAHPRKKIKSSSLNISAEELLFVRNRLFLLSQQIHFSNEYKFLLAKKEIEASSPLLTLAFSR